MSTAEARSPRQLQLAGQVHVAEGPLDMSAMYVMHHAFRRDLDRFPDAVRATPLDDRQVWRGLRLRWEQFAAMLHHHHGVEDRTIWPPLMEHVRAAGDHRGLETLKAMQAEHETIDPQLAACATAFTTMVESPSVPARQRLVELLDTTRESLARHLAHEETDALPLVQRHLPQAAWQASENEAKRTYRPQELAYLVPWAAAGLSTEALDRTFAAAGWPFRVLFRLTRGRFARSEAIAFRHSPTPAG